MLNWPSNEFVLVGVQQGSKTNTCVLVGHRLFWECSKADLLGHILLQSASTSSTCDAKNGGITIHQSFQGLGVCRDDPKVGKNLLR